jgi:glycerate dehydrogenase
MHVVVLDGYTLNPGDLSWDELKKLGTCEIYDRTPPEEVHRRAEGAQIVLTNKTVLSRVDIEQLPELRYIGVLATGYNIVDVGAARERGVPVTNVPTYGTQSVAQMVFAHLLNLAQRVGYHGQTVADGRWSACEDFCYWDYPLVELAGLTMGIVGFGRIGRATARLASAFGMKVLVYDPVLPSAVAEEVEPEEIEPEEIEIVELDAIFRLSDVISLHCPLTPETQQLVDRDRLALMKPSAFLINTSRGPLVDEQALVEALDSGGIAGAGLDVLAVEPPRADNPLLRAKNCFVTPHIAWATRSARERLLRTVVANVRAFIEGRPQNVVNVRA